ncbi:MAG: OmpA/MotB family protein [Gammaproteobacteria bacterium]
MNKDPFLKLQSSKTIEELLNDSGPDQNQNWLLSYLDVFVLIVMFIVTLISLGDIKPGETTVERPHSATPERFELSAAAVSNTPPTPTPEPQASIETTTVEPDTESMAAAENTADRANDPSTASDYNPERLVVSPSVQTQIEQHDAHDPIQASDTGLAEQPDEVPTTAPTELDVLSEQLDRLGLGQKVSLKVTEDYAQFEIQDKILFESSKAELTETGAELLVDLAPLLTQANGLIFIEGHTDNRPINTPQFPSNWELGAARAAGVLHFLATQGLNSRRMRAVTYADTLPVADNASAAGREKNRRVNILIKVKDPDIEP